jgi:hypothetical protein
MELPSLGLFSLTGNIHWRVPASGPVSYPVQHRGAPLRLANPLATLRVVDAFSGEGKQTLKLSGLAQRRDLLAKAGEVLVTTSTVAFFHAAGPKRFLPSIAWVIDLLRAVRVLSSQYSIPRQTGSVWTLPGALASVPEVRENPDIHCYVPHSAWDLAVTPDLFQKAATTDVLDLSAGHEVLIDAFEANVQRDFRKVVLYAAVAVEAIVGDVLDRRHQATLIAGSPANRPWVIEAEGKLDDPVYSRLRDARRFEQLLHERSLYVLGRSLKLDDPTLFGAAGSLYQARNEIAHSGRRRQADQYSLSPQGASSALDCARAVFDWYGETSGPREPDRQRWVQGNGVELVFPARTV